MDLCYRDCINRAREAALEMRFHMTLHFKVPVEQFVRVADAAFQDSGLLAAWWDGINMPTDDA